MKKERAREERNINKFVSFVEKLYKINCGGSCGATSKANSAVSCWHCRHSEKYNWSFLKNLLM